MDDTKRTLYEGKLARKEHIFSQIHRGDRIFIGTGCAEPQHLVKELVSYVKEHPKSLFDAELLDIWTLGVAPYAESGLQANFRSNSFLVGDNIRDAVNEGLADYTPVFLSELPDLIYKGLVPIDVALIQVSPPDEHGYMSLGISVDIVKAAVECADLVIAQVNSNMPRVYGDGFISLDEVDYLLEYDEPLLEYAVAEKDPVLEKIGENVAKLVHDGDTIQVGYGVVPTSVLGSLKDKKHLGVHSELLSDGLVDLISKGVVDNTKKTLNRGVSVASFCMGSKKAYDFVGDNLAVQLRTLDYTNDPLVIARQENMVAINSAFEIDLTGQATSESLEGRFYSGIGGQADFMRGAVLAKNGRSILALRSTSADGKRSNIAPFLQEKTGVTLNRGDVHYVVTEYGIAYLHGRNLRERAMELISLAHPRFRGHLLEEAKKHNLIYPDQRFISGMKGVYPEDIETYRATRSGLEFRLRPVRLSDEPLLKDFFYSLSDDSMYYRFISTRKDMPHKRLQEFVVIDYTEQMILLAVAGEEGDERVLGVGQYGIDPRLHMGDVAFVVRDDIQDQGIGTSMLKYLTYLAKKQGLLGFTAEVLIDNMHMLHLFEKMGFDIEKKEEEGLYELKMFFRGGRL